MGYRFTNSTNRVITNYTGFSFQRSYSFWSYRISAGGSSIGRYFTRQLTGGVNERIDGNGTTQTRYTVPYTGTSGIWAANGVTLNVWENWIVTHDASTTNVPKFYRNGINVNAGTATAASGTVVLPNNSPYIVGNGSVTLTIGFDGILSEFGIWNRILSPAEAYQIGAQRFSPALVPKGLTFYLPMLEDLQTRLVGNSYGYNAGTSISRAAHPKIVYPSEVIDSRVYVPSSPSTHPHLVLRRFV